MHAGLDHRLRPPCQLEASQLPGHFVTDLCRQIFDLGERSQGGQPLFFLSRQLHYNRQNPLPQPIIHDPVPVRFPV